MKWGEINKENLRWFLDRGVNKKFISDWECFRFEIFSVGNV